VIFILNFIQKFRYFITDHSELGALEGVEVKIGETFRPPSKVRIPVDLLCILIVAFDIFAYYFGHKILTQQISL